MVMSSGVVLSEAGNGGTCDESGKHLVPSQPATRLACQECALQDSMQLCLTFGAASGATAPKSDLQCPEDRENVDKRCLMHWRERALRSAPA